jgi:hypothetical protein
MVQPEKEVSAMEILFNKTIEECRELGAPGGRVHARDLRLRQTQGQNQPAAAVPPTAQGNGA